MRGASPAASRLDVFVRCATNDLAFGVHCSDELGDEVGVGCTHIVGDFDVGIDAVQLVETDVFFKCGDEERTEASIVELCDLRNAATPTPMDAKTLMPFACAS